METRIYCIIVTYNAKKWVDKCLTSLRESKTKITPVIIDNCSKDDTVAYIKEHYPEAHLIINDENRGFGQANNQGIEWAYKQGATHFFLLNQDAWILNDAITKAVYVQDKYDIDIAVPVHLNGEENAFDFGFNSYLIKDDLKSLILQDALLGKLKDCYEVNFVNAAGWIISRKTIEEVGGFDPIFFHYGEDVNYIQRIHFHSKNISIVPSCFMVHDRKQKGNIKVYNNTFVFTYLLSHFADVNRINKKPSLLIDIKVVLFVVKHMVKSIFSFDWKLLYMQTMGMVKVMSYKKRIRVSKINNSEIKHNWLDI